MAELKNILKLMAVPGVGPRRILNLMTYFKSVDRIFEADSRELCRVGGIDQRLADSILKTDTNRFVEDQLKSIENSPFKVTSYFDDDYPKKLKNIYDPPILLYRTGNFCEKDVDAIAIVGTRTPSEYGKAVAAKLVQGLVENQLTIISGFARGIDTEAHKTALRVGGRTIWLRKFDSVEDSIRAYYELIAKGKAFKKFRKTRYQTGNAYEIVKELDKYSEIGDLYAKELTKMIRYNKLTKYDN